MMIIQMAMTRGGSRHFAAVVAPSGNIWLVPVDPSDHGPVLMDLS